jgi:hypothetical protein
VVLRAVEVSQVATQLEEIKAALAPRQAPVRSPS